MDEKTEDITISQELVISEKHPLSSSTRFTVILILFTYKEVRVIELQKLLHLTPGKLDHHLNQLLAANYIQKSNKFVAARFFSAIVITDKGRNEFLKYSSQLKELLGKIPNIT